MWGRLNGGRGGTALSVERARRGRVRAESGKQLIDSSHKLRRGFPPARQAGRSVLLATAVHLYAVFRPSARLSEHVREKESGFDVV